MNQALYAHMNNKRKMKKKKKEKKNPCETITKGTLIFYVIINGTGKNYAESWLYVVSRG
jgi:hypothetical protein